MKLEPVAALADVAGLVAGTTLRDGSEGTSGPGGSDDFGLATGGSPWAVAERYEGLARRLGFPAAAVARQVHGTELVPAESAPDAGLWLAGEADGFVGVAAGRLFAVTVADCVPVYVVDPDTRAFALLHAGWRGAAAGILGRALERLGGGRDRPPALRVHLGPAICGTCYEVGPEVPRAFGRDPGGAGPLTFDLRAELRDRALSAGLEPSRVTISSRCTRCERDRLHSHRGADGRAGRMAAYLGWPA